MREIGHELLKYYHGPFRKFARTPTGKKLVHSSVFSEMQKLGR
jgi:hypothetical protein